MKSTRATAFLVALFLIFIGMAPSGTRGLSGAQGDPVLTELVARQDGAGDWVEIRTSAGDVQRFVAVLPSATPVPPTATPIVPTVTPVPPTQVPPTVTPVPPTATPVPGGGVPFGPFNWVPSDAWPFTISRVAVSTLPAARQYGIPVLVALAGKSGYTTGGCFDLTKYMAMLDTYLPQIAPYSDIVLGVYAIDEPHDWSCGPDGADLDAACARIQGAGLACGFNTPPSWLIGTGATGFDFWFTQTNFGRAQTGAEWAAWATEQLATAKAYKDVPVYLSQNAVTYSPTAAQIRDAAIALCESGADGSLFWAWTARDFTGMRAELEQAAAACAAP